MKLSEKKLTVTIEDDRLHIDCIREDGSGRLQNHSTEGLQERQILELIAEKVLLLLVLELREENK